jgi:hypothetical protein
MLIIVCPSILLAFLTSFFRPRPCPSVLLIGPNQKLTVGVGQYWANVTDGSVLIPHVRAGIYRLTIYAEGVFGQYEQDDVEVKAGDGSGAPFQVNWKAESHGTYECASSVSELINREGVVQTWHSR